MTEADIIDKLDQPDVKLGNSQFLQAKKYRFSPLLEGLFVGIVILVVTQATIYFVYAHAMNAQKEEIREGLLRVAKTIGVFIDGDLHKTITTREQMNSQDYLDAIEPMRLASESDDSIAYVYTAIMRESKVYFILDPTPSNLENDDGIDEKSYVMQEYKEASASMVRALKEQISVVEDSITIDRWGAFLSGYVPIYDQAGGFVAILGVDITANEYLSRLAPIKRATIRAKVSAILLAFLIGSLVWFMRNFASVINAKRLLLLEHHKNTSKSSGK